METEDDGENAMEIDEDIVPLLAALHDELCCWLVQKTYFTESGLILGFDTNEKIDGDENNGYKDFENIFDHIDIDQLKNYIAHMAIWLYSHIFAI